MPRKTKDTVTQSLWMIIDENEGKKRSDVKPGPESVIEEVSNSDSDGLDDHHEEAHTPDPRDNQSQYEYETGPPLTQEPTLPEQQRSQGGDNRDPGRGNGSPSGEGSEKVNFEDALTRLERQVRTLEQGGLPLEEAILAFEEGVQMFQIASAQLRTAELRIKQVLENSGELRLEPFEPPDLKNLTRNDESR